MIRILRTFLTAAGMGLTLFASPGFAQLENPNVVPNPYQITPGIWAELPDGRTWGTISAVYHAGTGNIWVAERCGGNQNCLDTPDLDPILLIDANGRVIKSFGAGLLVWPQGIFVDSESNVWIADGRGDPVRSKGHQVHKFSADGELLLSLGLPGIAGKGNGVFDQPNDILVAPNGDIFVSDGHSPDGNNRIVKFNNMGEYLTEWGGPGAGMGKFGIPHDLAMDSRGRLFVADRGNNRIQIFDQDGNWVDTWTQFGRPGGIYIDALDTLYVSDSESNSGPGRNSGWYRGIRIGSAISGFVSAFIPYPDTNRAEESRGGEGITADDHGNIFSAEVTQGMLRRYSRAP
jgi:DNA-binding beta-propeller fold protein YncE